MRKLLFFLAGLLVVLAYVFYQFLYPKFTILNGYAAKNMCSCVFVGGMDEATVKAVDLNFNLIGLADTKVDYQNKTVTASVWGIKPKTAYYNGPLGCALVSKMKPSERYRYPGNWSKKIYDSLANRFDKTDTIASLSDGQVEQLDRLVNTAFNEPDTAHPAVNTRAVVVLYKGQLVAEQYAPGFTKKSPLLGWSMTKSLTATMLGMLANQGKLALDDPTGIPAWQQDERKQITWKHLLQMNSGLRWKEDYANLSDAVRMLFDSDGVGAYATGLPLAAPPNTQWEYSSGTSNIIATAMQPYFASQEAYIRYPYDSLFYRIGAYSMLIEADATGHFVGSSYSWATARDWAKMGQLYLQNGRWEGQQVLPPWWVNFVQQPAPNSNNRYGGHVWLNKGGFLPDVPTDMYAFNGFQGQRVFIIPSQQMVVVRLGVTYNRNDFDFNTWLAQLIEVVKTKQG